MTTTHTVDGDLSAAIGVPLTSRNAIVTWATNLGDQALVDLDADITYPPGPNRIAVSDTGHISVELIDTSATTTNVEPDTLQYWIEVQYWDAAGRKRKWDTGWFALTADTDLSDIVGTDLITPEFASAAMAQIQALIDSGAVGPAGPANTLAIGTVTTGAAGSSASATVTGSAPSQTLSLTIPRGNPGVDGAPGAPGATGPAGPVTVVANAQTDNYTLVLADAGKVIELTAATGKNVTVPTNATVAFDIGTLIEVTQMGAGQITLVPAGGVTLRYASSLITRAQYSSLTLRKRATNEWVVGGDAQ